MTGQFEHCATRLPLNLLYFLIGCQHFHMLLQSENTLWPYWTFFVVLRTADRFRSHILVQNYTLSLLHSHMHATTVNRWSNVPQYVLRRMFSKYSNTLWCLQELNKKNSFMCSLKLTFYFKHPSQTIQMGVLSSTSLFDNIESGLKMEGRGERCDDS